MQQNVKGICKGWKSMTCPRCLFEWQQELFCSSGGLGCHQASEMLDRMFLGQPVSSRPGEQLCRPRCQMCSFCSLISQPTGETTGINLNMSLMSWVFSSQYLVRRSNHFDFAGNSWKEFVQATLWREIEQASPGAVLLTCRADWLFSAWRGSSAQWGWSCRPGVPLASERVCV